MLSCKHWKNIIKLNIGKKLVKIIDNGNAGIHTKDITIVPGYNTTLNIRVQDDTFSEKYINRDYIELMGSFVNAFKYDMAFVTELLDTMSNVYEYDIVDIYGGDKHINILGIRSDIGMVLDIFVDILSKHGVLEILPGDTAHEGIEIFNIPS